MSEERDEISDELDRRPDRRPATGLDVPGGRSCFAEDVLC